MMKYLILGIIMLISLPLIIAESNFALYNFALCNASKFTSALDDYGCSDNGTINQSLFNFSANDSILLFNNASFWFNNTFISNSTIRRCDYSYNWNITCRGSCHLAYNPENDTWTELDDYKNLSYIEYPKKCRKVYWSIFGWNVFMIRC